MHCLFDKGKNRDELVVRRHHPLVRRAFSTSGLDHLRKGLKHVGAIAGKYRGRSGWGLSGIDLK